MAMNILINELVGIIPGLGDAFSFWFKSNVRNYKLLRRYSAAPVGSRRGDWIFVIAVLSLLFVIVCGGLIVTVLVLQAIGRFLHVVIVKGVNRLACVSITLPASA
jgi:hypothetical protein